MKIRLADTETQEETFTLEEVLESIKFNYYDQTIYNSYAFYSTKQLKKLLEALTLLNDNSKNNKQMIVTNSMMQDNLELFVSNLIQGKYVVKQ